MENPAGRDRPRLHIVETPVNEPAPGDEHPRPHLEIALYPQRLDRTAPPMSLSPSQAVRYAEDPGRAEEAARTAGSRQVVEGASLAALWNESGATAHDAPPAQHEPELENGHRAPEPAARAPEPASWTPEPTPWTPQPEAPATEPEALAPEPEAAPPRPVSRRTTQPWYAAAAAAGGTRRSPWWRRLLRHG